MSRLYDTRSNAGDYQLVVTRRIVGSMDSNSTSRVHIIQFSTQTNLRMIVALRHFLYLLLCHGKIQEKLRQNSRLLHQAEQTV